MKTWLLFAAVSFAQWIQPQKEDSQSESGRSFPLAGGGKQPSNEEMERLFDITTESDVALEVDAPQKKLKPIPPRFSYLESKYQYCRDVFNVQVDQGNCNSCWAFASVNTVQYLFCRATVDAGISGVGVGMLSPIYPICSIRADEGGRIAPCDPQSLDVAFNFIQGRYVTQKTAPGCTNFASSRRGGVLMNRPFDTADVDAGDCEKVIPNLQACHHPAYTITRARAVLGWAKMKRKVFESTAIAIVVRLTKEFVAFTGGIFNPDSFTFLSSSNPDESIPANAPEDEWYNHFMTMVGYGVTPEGLEYAIVQNSWGLIYSGEGWISKRYEDNYVSGGRSSFFALAVTAAGRGKLEATTRYAVYPEGPALWRKDGARNIKKVPLSSYNPRLPKAGQEVLSLLNRSYRRTTENSEMRVFNARASDSTDPIHEFVKDQEVITADPLLE